MSNSNTSPIETISLRDPRTNEFVEVPVSAIQNTTPSEPQSPSAMPAQAVSDELTEPKTRRHPPFRNHRDGAAGWAVVGDGTYWYSTHSDKLKEWMAEHRSAIADKLGISVEAFEENRYIADTEYNRTQIKKMKAAERPELANVAELKKLPIYTEEIIDRQIEECIVDWDWDLEEFPLTPTNKRSLFLEVKTELAEIINRSTQTGVSQARFLQQSFSGLLS